MGRKLVAALCAVVGVPVFLAAAVQLLIDFGYAQLQADQGAHAIWWWHSEEIEAGIQSPQHGTVISFETIGKLDAAAMSWRMLIGRFHTWNPLHPSLKLLSWLEPSDAEGRFCRQLIQYRWLHVAQSGSFYPCVRATNTEVLHFIEACRKEIPNLGTEERQLLDGYIKSGRIDADVISRSLYDMDALGREARANPLPYPNPKLPRDELLRTLNESIEASIWAGLLKELPRSMIEYYGLMDLRQVPTIGSSWREVADAIRASSIAKFDAVPLLPRRLFNITIKGLADIEGKDADRMFVMSNSFRPISLSAFGERMEVIRPYYLSAHTVADYRTVTSFGNGPNTPELAAVPEIKARVEELMDVYQVKLKDKTTVGYINNRRLKKTYEMLNVPKIIRELGMEDDVLRDEGFMWMGPFRGGFHYDEEANIYVQLSGESDVFLIPPSHVNLYTNGQRHKDLPTKEELEHDLHVQKVPFHLLHLKPGNAVTFPGRGFHIFLAQSPTRLAVNFFFLPKWKKMMYDEHDWYTSEYKYPLGPERLAVRQLWARTFARLYEERGEAVIYMGEKNEYI